MKRKKSEREKKKKSILFFQSYNNIRCSNSCVVDHHATSHRHLLLSCTKMCVCAETDFLLFCLFYWLLLLVSRLFFFTTLQCWKKRDLACCHSLIHSNTCLTLAETTYKKNEKSKITCQ
jgi:hypothetical protein